MYIQWNPDFSGLKLIRGRIKLGGARITVKQFQGKIHLVWIIRRSEKWGFEIPGVKLQSSKFKGNNLGFVLLGGLEKSAFLCSCNVKSKVNLWFKSSKIKLLYVNHLSSDRIPITSCYFAQCLGSHVLIFFHQFTTPYPVKVEPKKCRYF